MVKVVVREIELFESDALSDLLKGLGLCQRVKITSYKFTGFEPFRNKNKPFMEKNIPIIQELFQCRHFTQPKLSFVSELLNLVDSHIQPRAF